MSALFTNPIVLAVAAASILIAGVAVFYLFNQKSDTEETDFDCVSKHQLLSDNERNALIYLRRNVANMGHVCPRVGLSHLVEATGASDAKQFKRALNDLATDYVDFVVMDPVGNIEFAVHLDAGHEKPSKQKKEDDFVVDLFQKANIELIKVLPRKLERSDELEFALARLKNKRLERRTDETAASPAPVATNAA